MVMSMRWRIALVLLAWATGGLAEVVTRGPILIHSVEDLLGLASGLGTIASPFVIEGLRVDAEGEPFGILISNTSVPLILRNLEIYGASVAAIRLQNVQNLVMENVLVRGSLTGILVGGSKNIVVKETRVENCADGIRLMFSAEITLHKVGVRKTGVGIWLQGTRASTITASVIELNGLGLLLELESTGNIVSKNAFLGNHVHAQSCGKNQFDDGQNGNFWEGFSATDKDGDGIFDEAYLIGPDADRFPLCSLP